MYSYTAASLAIRAKCSLSSYCLFLPNDRPYCCHRSCCHSCSHFLATGLFPASPRILYDYLLGQSALIPSGTFFLSGRRRLRVSCRSRDLDAGLSEMMGLLTEQEEIFPGEDRNRKEMHLRDLSWKKGRREIEIRLVDEDRRSSRGEAKTERSSSRRRERSSSSSVFSTSSLLRGSELNEAVSRRTGGKSISGYGNAKEGSKFDAVDITEKDVREVHKYVDDSWRGRKDSYKRDVVTDSRKDESLKTNASFRWPAVNDEPQQVSSRENESVKGTRMVARTSEAQRDDVRRTSVSAKVRKVERGESSTSAARQDSDVSRVAQHAALRRNAARECEVASFHYSDVQRAAYPGKDFEERTRGREETCMEQHTQQVRGDKKIHPDWQAVQEDESRRSTQRLGEVSVFQDNNFERASYIDNERVKGMDASSILIQDSIQVSRDKRTEMELQMYEENRVNEGKEDPIERNLNQSRIGKINQFNRRTSELDDSIRNTQMLSEVSEIHDGNVEATSHVRGKRGKRVTGTEFSSDFFRSSVFATKDIGTQVGMNEAYEDQIGMSRFSSNNIVNATSSQSPPASRFDPQECSAVLALNQVSSTIEQPSLAKQDYVQYSARAESERGSKEFDLTRGHKKSSIQETYNSRIENKKESSEENSSVILCQERNESQRSHLTGENRQSTAMHLASSGSLHGISSSLSNQGEVDNQAGRVDIQQIRYETIEPARRLDKFSALHVGEFVDKLQKEIVSLNDPGNTSNASSGINIEEQGMNNSQAALRIQNQKEISSAETSSIVLNQERKERHNSLIIGGSSETTTRKMASSGSAVVVPSSLQTHIEVGNCSGGDDIQQIDNDTIESARLLDKSSAQHVGEFVKNLHQEIMTLDKSEKEPNASIGIQIEETGRRETQVTTDIEAGELNESRSYKDGRYRKENRRLSSSGMGVKGPSDEMWNVQVLSSKEHSIAEVPNEDSSTEGAIDITSATPTSESAISRRSHKSLWSYVVDIIRMSWVLRGQTHMKSDKRDSSNESTSSEAWFSGPEPDEDGAEDEKQDKERSGLTKKSALMQEPVKLAFEDSKFRDRLTARESNSSFSSSSKKRGLSARIASSSGEAEQTEDAKASQETISSLAMFQQKPSSKADAASPSITNVVESRVGNKVKVLKPSSSYSAGMKKIGFSSRITEDIPQIEGAQVRDNNISGFEILEQPPVSTTDSVILRVSDTEAVDMPFNEIPKLQLDPFREKLPEVGGTKVAEMKQRKLHRNKQVLSEQFDEWEEAFKRETEQKKNDEFFMREAILEAKKGAVTWEVPVGAVLVQNGKIIARSCNLVEEMRDATAHAEMICIREASNLLRTWRLAETTLYVTLEPCPMCAGAILQARIDTVVWGAPNRLLGADGSWVRLFPGGDGVSSSSLVPPGQMVGPIHPFHPKITIRRGVLATECGDVMQQFFKLRRRKDKKPEPSPPSCLPIISNRPTKFFTKFHNIFCMMFCL